MSTTAPARPHRAERLPLSVLVGVTASVTVPSLREDDGEHDGEHDGEAAAEAVRPVPAGA
ncbi:hypothetical protein ABZY83_01515 [Streptomyces virginiae]|uniref:hypothetical protein n=1 Tax=Streptomyces TaxID=1883 RepID=UPI0006B054C6|nr:MULTISPECIES: hypothetical protein [unclassified Streptomyces]KOU75178.1 hypothetical protein ADK61_16365 [Streptomyces sp. XY66]KOU98440.1 hypothetical protein ADK93_00180 [Streptomyces sp. XY58]KOV07614.1 hypothetical protein ADK89_10060 [Streptomyces sp. XY37]KOV43046.1 hypothetical protein ADK99_28880 [Streptomyces sp. MMG1064]KOV48965.1 hypothetical protein ADK97_00180 [Streptomyces sp. H021]